jgi:ribokinase
MRSLEPSRQRPPDVPTPNGRVVVVGSINVDLVVAASRLPHPGETVIGGAFARHLGGKGANQAVAAARAGATVAMVGAVGQDADGDESLAALEAEGIDVSRIRRVNAPTGVALIAVAPDGENQIVVAPGANALLSTDDVSLRDLPAGPGVMLTCLEIPMPAVIASVAAAARIGMKAMVNPAPAQALPQKLLASVEILTPNAQELLLLTGATDVEGGVSSLLAAGARAVVVTLGANGALLAEGRRRRSIPALAVEVVDTTGAGDTFAGVLAAWLATGQGLDEAVDAANRAAGLSVTHSGARTGVPGRSAIEDTLRA